MTNFIKNSEKVVVENYPYGGLRTTLYDTIDFSPKKGFRHVTQTINPKTNRINNPKKGTYSEILIRYYDEINHIKVKSFDTNSFEGINKTAKFVHENFDLFTKEEISYILMIIIRGIKINTQAKMAYCGASLENIKPLIDKQLTLAVALLKEPKNEFDGIVFDLEALKNTEVKDYNPFSISRG